MRKSFTFVVAILVLGCAVAGTVVSSASDCMDLVDTTVATNSIVLARYQDEFAVCYSSTLWNEQLSDDATCKLTLDGQVVASLSGEGSYVLPRWPRAGKYTLQFTSMGSVITKVIALTAPVVAIERYEYDTCRLVPSVEGVEIRYTLDGSEPTKESLLYTGPFHIAADALSFVKACTCGDGGLLGEIAYDFFEKAGGLMSVCDSQFSLDTSIGKAPLAIDGELPITWSGMWNGNSSIDAVISEGGTAIFSAQGEGVYTYYPRSVGETTLTHMTTKDGVIVGEVYSVAVNVSPRLARGRVVDGLAVIPLGVTEIAPNAFAGREDLTSVTIPPTVTNIAATAFAGCTGIREVTLSADSAALSELFPDAYATVERAALDDGVSVGAGFFAGCAALETVTLPAGVTSIGAGAFSGCTNLSRVNVTSVEQWSMMALADADANPVTQGAVVYVDGEPLTGRDCDSDGFVIVDGWVLDYRDREAASVVVPDGVIGIGPDAFADMWDLEAVKLPDSLKYIGRSAFDTCTYLDDVVIPDSVEDIGPDAFADCSWMQTLTLGANVRTVGAGAFAGCTQLATVQFADGLESIGAEAFAGDWRLMSVALPLSVSAVDSSAFTGCTGLAGVTVPAGVAPLADWFAPVYRQIRNVTVPAGETDVCVNMFSNCTALVSVELRNGVTNIADGAFYNCTALTTAGLPSTVRSVGARAFYNCDALTAMALPDGVATLGEYAFYDCYALRDVALPKNLTELRNGVFGNCSRLDSLYVPASVTNLGSRIIGSSVRSVYYMGAAPSYAADCYAGTSSSLTSYVNYGTRGWDGRPASRDLPQNWPVGNSYARAISTWSPIQFDVTFDAGEGLFAPVVTNTYACEQLTYTAYSLPPYDPVRTGFKFNGWWTETDGGTEVTAATGVKLTKAHTLYAHWLERPTITVRFNPNGGTVAPDEVRYTVETTYGAFPVPTREHYVFSGWYTAPTGGQRMREAMEVPAADRELFAHWMPAVYYIRFNAANGSGATRMQPFTYGQDVTLMRNPFSCSGCTFTGWALTEGGEAVYADGKTLSDFAAIQDGVIDLYAVWTGNTYAVRFDSHGGVGSMPNQTFVMGVEQTLFANAFTRDGYLFAGWALTTEAEVSYPDGARVVDLTSLPKATVVLYAVWTRDPDAPLALEEYVGCTNLTLVNDATLPWTGTMAVSHDGFGALRSGGADDAASVLKTTLVGPGTLGFWWKVSSETYKKQQIDYVSFRLDGEEQQWIGGEVDWQQVSVDIPAGSHEIAWAYVKDETDGDGDDCAWLDQVVWTGEAQPSEPVLEDAVVGTELTGLDRTVVVPATWVTEYLERQYGEGKAEAFKTQFGSNLAEALGKTTGKVDRDGRQLRVWDDYVAGTDPTDPDSRLKMTVELVDGKVRLSWTPDQNADGVSRIYTLYGRTSLGEGDWVSPVKPNHRFFRVMVSLPSGDAGEETSVSGMEFEPEKDLGGVQLWEGGPYWAECNVGATKPEEYGYYFWWGDTVGYKRNAADDGWVSVKTGGAFTFSSANCPTYGKDSFALKSAGYIDSTGNLVAQYDAATAHLGAPWRMPTDAEFTALISNCTTTWTTRNGVYGRQVTGKGAYSSKSIFLPAAGYGDVSDFGDAGSHGRYWSSTPYLGDSYSAWFLYFYSGDFHRDYNYRRYYGRSVRPVRGFAQ